MTGVGSQSPNHREGLSAVDRVTGDNEYVTSTNRRLDVNAVMDGGTLVPEDFDYIDADYPNATTEVYTYKLGGAAGTTVAVVTVVYTDATKNFIDTVTRT